MFISSSTATNSSVEPPPSTSAAGAPLRSPRALQLEPVLVSKWPLLAWLAQCEPSGRRVTVFHGPHVEVTDEWFCEAVWSGTYASGDFDRTDIVAGSGGRIRGGEIVFVSAGSTVDRLHSIDTGGAALVSNSLSCLLSAVNGRINRSSAHYYWLFRTIVRGIRHYRRAFPSSAGNIQLTYFDNLAWDGRSLCARSKPGLGRDFSTFGRYSGFLQSSMDALAANAADPARRHRYELLSTASSGYDSSTVTVLANKAGAREVLCFEANRDLNDSGEPLAKCLGMTPVVVPRGDWMSAKMPEPPFIAADSHGGDVFYRGAESTLRGKVLLTGYHGDKIWAKESKAANENIVRGDQSGLSLTDYRLMTGMLHCPVAFWGVRQIADVHALSNAPEMAPWDVPGDYSRPICRRLVETAGVSRELFGQKKSATWVQLAWNRQFLSPDSMRDYLEWLDERRSDFLRRGQVPPLMVRKLDRLDVTARKAISNAARAADHWAVRALKATGLLRVACRVGEKPSYLRRHLFAWALERHLGAYPRAF